MTDAPLDTRVTNGRFVDSHGPVRSSLTIHEGLVVESQDQRDVWRTVNASRHLVLPGMIQPGDPSLEAALDLVRGGVTTILSSAEAAAGIACVDFVLTARVPIQSLAIESADGRLSEVEWDLILGDEPLHVGAPADPAFPMIQFLYHEGHVRRGLQLERIVEITAGSIARALDLYPKKASFAGGSDGDLYVFDPETPDPYREARWPGRVIFSLQRGNILLYNGQIHTSPGDGKQVGQTWRDG